MDVVKRFNNLTGWINYKLLYEDGSSGIEQYEFKDFWSFKNLLSKRFLDELKEDYDYDDITLEEIHFLDSDNKFHLHMTNGYFSACCHNEIDSKLIDESYTKKLNLINDQAEKAKNILEQITKYTS